MFGLFRINNWKIASKLIFIAVVGVLGIFVNSYLGYRGIRNLHASMTAMITKDVSLLDGTAKAIEEMRVAQVRFYQAVADPARAPEVDKTFRQKMDDLKKSQANLSTLMEGTAAFSGKAQTLQFTIDKFQNSLTRAMDKAVQYDSAGALEDYNAEAKQDTTELRDMLASVLEIIEGEIKNTSSITEGVLNRTLWSYIWAALVCVILLAVVCYIMNLSMNKGIKRIMKFTANIADGNLVPFADQVYGHRKDELGSVQRSLEKMRVSLADVLQVFSDSAQKITQASEFLTHSSGQTAQMAVTVADNISSATKVVRNQNDAVQQGTAGLKHISESMAIIFDESSAVTDNAKETTQKAKDGASTAAQTALQIQEVEKTVASSTEFVNKLGESSQEIGSIVDDIRSLATQTNLLALNAAIEAARAGEAGRGFSVVAEEVKKLAEQSRVSTEKIADLIDTIQQDMDNAVMSMREGNKAVVEGAKSVNMLQEMFSNINELSKGVLEKSVTMKNSVDAVTKDMESVTSSIVLIDEKSDALAAQMQNVSLVTEKQSSEAKDVASSSDSLEQLALELLEAVGHFKL